MPPMEKSGAVPVWFSCCWRQDDRNDILDLEEEAKNRTITGRAGRSYNRGEVNLKQRANYVISIKRTGDLP